MAKLYPPYIEGKLPAQVGDNLVIPYEENRAVGQSDYAKFSLLIKTIATDKQIGELKSSGQTSTFSLSQLLPLSLNDGQYYKAQLAYMDTNDTVGYYSTVGVFRYLQNAPTVTIEAEQDRLKYIGKYTYKDSTEKVYYYRFILSSSAGVVLDDTDWLIHNAASDEYGEDGYSSIDQYICNVVLEDFNLYTLTYKVQTSSGLELSTSPIGIEMVTEGVAFPSYITLTAICNEDDGYNSVYLNYDENLTLKRVQGTFKLLRTSSAENFNKWLTIGQFTINQPVMAGSKYEIYRDFLTEHGVTYQYALCQVNDTIQTQQTTSLKVTSQFEDAFLYDGKQQLKVQYNPKISNFKTTVLESKQDTIGGKFPFVFRNGRVAYQEFSISGLISYLTDKNEIFTTHKFIFDQDNNGSATDLTPQNIFTERNFRTEVLAWLNNGKPKIFKSPTEGTFLIRLMNVSLTPEDKLGRMLYTFNCQAYEIDEINEKSLLQYNFIGNIVSLIDDFIYTSYNLYDGTTPLDWSYTSIRGGGPAIAATIVNASENDKFTLEFKDKTQVAITIGFTGTYVIHIDKDNPLVLVYNHSGNQGTGAFLQYGYNNTETNFPIVDENNDEIEPTTYTNYFDQIYGRSSEARDILTGSWTSLYLIQFIRLQKKFLQKGYFVDGRFYSDVAYTSELVGNKTTIYKDNNNDTYYIWNKDNGNGQSGYSPVQTIDDLSLYDYKIGTTKYSLDASGRIEFTKYDFDSPLPNQLQFLIGSGLFADVNYIVVM